MGSRTTIHGCSHHQNIRDTVMCRDIDDCTADHNFSSDQYAGTLSQVRGNIARNMVGHSNMNVTLWGTQILIRGKPLLACHLLHLAIQVQFGLTCASVSGSR